VSWDEGHTGPRTEVWDEKTLSPRTAALWDEGHMGPRTAGAIRKDTWQSSGTVGGTCGCQDRHSCGCMEGRG
jgi:hypothetical protein